MRTDGDLMASSSEDAIEGKPGEMFISIADSLIAEGELKGLSKALFRVLEHRALLIPESVRELVSSTRDEQQLERWIDRAFAASSVAEVFGGLDGVTGLAATARDR